MSAEVGQSAPELTAINNERQPVTLADLKGKTTVLVFFPGARLRFGEHPIKRKQHRNFQRDLNSGGREKPSYLH